MKWASKCWNDLRVRPGEELFRRDSVKCAGAAGREWEAGKYA